MRPSGRRSSASAPTALSVADDDQPQPSRTAQTRSLVRRARRQLVQPLIEDENALVNLDRLAEIHQLERELDAEDEFERLRSLGKIRQ